MKSLLIDGYNLIFAHAQLREKMNSKPEDARRALLDLCRIFAGRRGDIRRLWVVFDGREDHFSLPPGETRGVREIYTRAGETADKRMARIVRDDGEEAGWVVVSNDRAVVDRCTAYGASGMKATEFVRELNKQESGTPGKTQTAGEEPKIAPHLAARITAEYKQRLGLK